MVRRRRAWRRNRPSGGSVSMQISSSSPDRAATRRDSGTTSRLRTRRCRRSRGRSYGCRSGRGQPWVRSPHSSLPRSPRGFCIRRQCFRSARRSSASRSRTSIVHPSYGPARPTLLRLSIAADSSLERSCSSRRAPDSRPDSCSLPENLLANPPPVARPWMSRQTKTAKGMRADRA